MVTDHKTKSRSALGGIKSDDGSLHPFGVEPRGGGTVKVCVGANKIESYPWRKDQELARATGFFLEQRLVRVEAKENLLGERDIYHSVVVGEDAVGPRIETISRFMVSILGISSGIVSVRMPQSKQYPR